MKEMIYTPQMGKAEILYKGEYKEHKFCILNLGWHPTAYVEYKLDSSMDIRGDKRLDDISVHGGFTYFDGVNWDDKEDKSIYLGWDYSHCFDYSGMYLKYPDMYQDSHLKKWTTSEIFEEVKSVIEQLIVLEESEDK